MFGVSALSGSCKRISILAGASARMDTEANLLGARAMGALGAKRNTAVLRRGASKLAPRRNETVGYTDLDTLRKSIALMIYGILGSHTH